MFATARLSHLLQSSRRLSGFRSLSTQPFDLYGFVLSQPARSIVLLCEENNISYNLIPVDARNLETRKPEFLKLFPVGLVPAINDNGFLLTEAAAILQYLSEKHQLNDWYPTGKSLSDIQRRAQINFWLHWHHSNMRLSTRSILIPYHYPPKGVTKEDAVAKGCKEYSKGVKFLESYLKKRFQSSDYKDKFLCSSNKPTIADLLLIPEIDQVSKEAFNLFDYSPYPNVLRWMENIRETVPSYAANFKNILPYKDPANWPDVVSLIKKLQQEKAQKQG